MEVTQQQWDDMFAITTRGTFYTMRAAIRQMIDAGKGGTIVNISSVCAQHCSIFANAHYDAAKAGVEALRSEEHTSALQSLMRTSYAVLCLQTHNKPVNT